MVDFERAFGHAVADVRHSGIHVATAALGSPSPGQLTVAFRYAPEGIFSNVTDRDSEGHSMSTVAETSPASPSLRSVTT